MTKVKGKLHRIGDLVLTLKGYNPSQQYYCKIIDIIDNDGISYNEYDIITGYGDLNSKVTVNLLALGIETNFKTEIDELEYGLVLSNINPHDIFLKDPNSLIEKSNKEIEYHNKNITFFEKNKNIIELREEKINKILE